MRRMAGEIPLGDGLNARQALIVERVNSDGFVTIETLARDLDVSAQTVRREIIRLDEIGLIQRFHGGAGRRGSGARLTYEAKRSLDVELKRRIGEAMAARVKDGEALFLDVGTTAEATAQALSGRRGLTVVTPGTTVGRILSEGSDATVILTGGRLVGADLCMVGPVALSAIGQYRFDWAIIACSGIEESGAVLDFDADKIALKRQALARARQKALIAGSSKFRRSALMHLADLDAFDILVTDEPPDASIVRLIEERLGEDALIVAPR